MWALTSTKISLKVTRAWSSAAEVICPPGWAGQIYVKLSGSQANAGADLTVLRALGA